MEMVGLGKNKKDKCYSYSGRQTSTRKDMETNYGEDMWVR